MLRMFSYKRVKLCECRGFIDTKFHRFIVILYFVAKLVKNSMYKDEYCSGMITRTIILRPLNRFPTGTLSITFSNQKEYCEGNKKRSVKHKLKSFLSPLCQRRLLGHLFEL